MLAVRKQDPTFVNYVPGTACEAVERFLRCRRNGLKPFLVPECLIECSKGLQELNMFEEWMINPAGSDLSEVELYDLDEMRTVENRKFQETAARIEAELSATPPVPLLPAAAAAHPVCNDEAHNGDEKDDEKSEPVSATTRATTREVAPAACSGAPAKSAPTSTTGPPTPS